MQFMPMIVCVFYFYEKVISVVLNSLNVRLNFLVAFHGVVLSVGSYNEHFRVV